MTELLPFLPGFAAAYAILLVGASSPGPSVALLVSIATAQGRAPALVATLGIATGSATINALTMLGVGFLISQASWAFVVLRSLGALYLLYLAWGAFRRSANPPALGTVATVVRSPFRNFLLGYLLQVTNPKAIAFWLAIAAIGATEGGSAFVVVSFVAGGFVLSFACHGAWALLMSTTLMRDAYAKGRRWIEATLGVLFVFFALKLAFSQR